MVSTGDKDYQVRSWDGSVVSEYKSKFDEIMRKSDLSQDDEETIQSIIGYIFPIHSVETKNIETKADFDTLYAYDVEHRKIF